GRRVADVRYRGQSWSVPIELPGDLDEAGIGALVERFEDEHEQLYGMRLEPGSPIDIRALRLAALGPERAPFALPAGERDATGTRVADFGPIHGELVTPVVARAALAAEPRPGPLLVDEYDTTVVVPP